MFSLVFPGVGSGGGACFPFPARFLNVTRAPDLGELTRFYGLDLVCEKCSPDVSSFFVDMEPSNKSILFWTASSD